MIRHLVLLNVNTGVKQALFAALEGLKSRLERIVDFRSGPNVSVEPGMDKGFMNALWIDFASAHVRDAYLLDQEHRLTGGRINSSTVGGTDGVIVVGIGI
ncbi:hypothetical protein FHT80_005725 [Rhizobium sp. BK226]|uniref:Dabb family protein n=1 Tax=Rhizobium sp. BK226 TaxID=2587075 RepID=UPI0016223203|nr:Dabb family protein [Rhizobium sp. BK226]MBB4116351.1 hypothetical protein [Rhizobium sp. BK226]